MVRKYYTRTIETEKGHMKAGWKNFRSAKQEIHEMTAVIQLTAA